MDVFKFLTHANDRYIHWSNGIFPFVSVLRDEFRALPQNTRAAQGETALLECGPPRGHPEPTIYWKKNEEILDVEADRRIRIVDGGNLAIQDVQKTDDGKYQCVAKNAVGFRESPIALLKVHGKCTCNSLKCR